MHDVIGTPAPDVPLWLRCVGGDPSGEVFGISRGEHADVYRAASPMHRVHAAAPPFFLTHGVNDSLVPVEQARLFAERLRAVGQAPVVYAELPGAQHAFDIFGSPRAQAAAEAVAAFLGFVYGQYLAREGTPRNAAP